MKKRNPSHKRFFTAKPRSAAKHTRYPPKKIAVTLPMDERNTRLVDFNKDSQQDILMYHPSTTDAHRVTLLIAQ